MKIIFITGTDTGIGKTFITAALTKALGKQVGVVKAVQTGYPPDNDMKTIQKLTKLPNQHFFSPYKFKYPLAPQQAAELEKKSLVEPKFLSKSIKQFAKQWAYCLVEGSGGVFVPIKPNYYFLDLIKDLNAECIVVARSGLGTINHTLLTVNALRQRRIKIKGLIINTEKPGKKDLASQLNPKVLKAVTRLPILAVIPYQRSGKLPDLRQSLKDF